MPFFSLRKTMRSVTSSRFIGFINAPMSGSRFKFSSYLGLEQESPALRVELLVDAVRDLQELVLADITRRDRVTHLAVDPVEHAHLAFFSVAERGFPVAGNLGADVERDARALLRLIHEVRDRAGVTRQQTAAHQAVADLVELRREQRCAEPLREPGDEMRLLVGADRSEERRVGKECRSRW